MAAADALARSFRAVVEGSGAAVTGGWVHHTAASLLRVTVRRAHKDLLLGKSRPSLQSYVVDAGSGSWAALPPTPLDPASLMVSASPSGRYVCVVRKDAPAGGDPGAAKARTVLELWATESGSVVRAIHVDAKAHGDPISDSWFGAGGDGAVAWNADESAVAYVAEAPPPEAAGFLDAAPGVARGGQFDFAAKECWGERYEGVRSPRLFIAHWAAGTVVAVPGVPDDLSAGQVVWAPPATAADEGGPPRAALVFVGWSTGTRRLGEEGDVLGGACAQVAARRGADSLMVRAKARWPLLHLRALLCSPPPHPPPLHPQG